MSKKPTYEKLEQRIKELEKSISESRLIEQSLRRDNAMHSAMIENIGDVIGIIDANGIIKYQSQNIEKSWGWNSKDIIGTKALDYVHPKDLKRIQQKLSEGLEKNTLSKVECRLKCKDGKYKWIELTGVNRIKNPVINGVLINYHDITEQKQAKEELILNKLLLRNVLDIVPVFICAKNLDGKFILVNKKLTDFYGSTVEAMTNVNHADLCEDKNELHAMLADDREVIESGKPKFIPKETMKNPDGSNLVLETHKIPFTAMGKPAVLIASKDITKCKLVEKALIESAIKYHSVFNNTLEAILIHASDTMEILDANWSATSMYGYSLEDFLSLKIPQLSNEPQKTLKTLIEIDQQKIQKSYIPIRYHKKKDGTTFPVEIMAARLTLKNKDIIVTSIRDITARIKADTDKKILETKLRHSQKMESIGTLAGGIAHDFNNILSAIIGFTELSIAEKISAKEIQDNLNEILVSSLRARDLVKHILTFARKNETFKKHSNIGKIIQDVLSMMRSTTPATINITNEIDTTLLVFADPTQIHQVFVNLCTNSVHAMKEKGGTLNISVSKINITKNATLSPLFKKQDLLKPGGYVEIKVSDTGTGIDEKNIVSIFDPYFTTKSINEGSGLGLSVVHGIVKSCGGEIFVHSTLNKGTTFSIYFPISIESLTKTKKLSNKPTKGTERILLVDDELSIAKFSKIALERFGYKLETFTKCSEALNALRAEPDSFDLLITDMAMPEMDGTLLAEKAKDIKSNLPIIICTGFSEKLLKKENLNSNIKAFLEKPFKIKKLAETIRKILD